MWCTFAATCCWLRPAMWYLSIVSDVDYKRAGYTTLMESLTNEQVILISQHFWQLFVSFTYGISLSLEVFKYLIYLPSSWENFTLIGSHRWCLFLLDAAFLINTDLEVLLKTKADIDFSESFFSRWHTNSKPLSVWWQHILVKAMTSIHYWLVIIAFGWLSRILQQEFMHTSTRTMG